MTTTGTAAPAKRATTLLRGGTVLVDPADPSADASALAIAGGRVLAVGGSELDALADADTEIVELDGRAVIPGLIDDHLHLAAYGMSLGSYLEVGPAVVGAWEELGAALEGASLDETGWVRCHGWDDAVLGRPGTAADVDAALERAGLGDVPCVLFDMTGHRLLLGTEALRVTGLLDSSAHEDGCFVDGGMAAALDRIPERGLAVLERAILAAQADLLARGITGITEPGLGPGGRALLDGASGTLAIEAYRSLAERGELRVRVAVLLLCSGTGAASAAETAGVLATKLPRALEGADPRRLVIRGVKVFADGTPRSATAWFHEPYAGAPTGGAMVVIGDDEAARTAELDAIIATISRAGLSAHVHATGDATAAAAVDAMLRHPAGVGAHTIIHGDFLDDATLERMGAGGIRWTSNPEIARNAAPITERVLGPERARRRGPVESALQHGVIASISSDAPVVEPDWRRSMHAVITRPFGPAASPSALTTRQALDLMTGAAARGDGTDAWRGRLVPGSVADLVVLGAGWPEDPEALLDLEVESTWVDGTKVALAPGVSHARHAPAGRGIPQRKGTS